MVLWFLVFAASGYLFLVAVGYLFQARFLYFPSRPWWTTPADAGVAYEDVRFPAADGVTLSGWWVPAPDAVGALLFFHGNAGNISHRMDSVRIFRDLGWSVFIFDYRGYGQSEGRPTEHGTYADALGAWHYLTGTRGLAPDQIVLFGRSLGGAIATWLATRVRPAALMVESTFTSVPDVARVHYPFLPVRWIARYRYPTLTYMGKVTCPVLVIHSRDDEMVPYAQGRALFSKAPEPRHFLDLRGSHNDVFWVQREHYVHGLRSFLKSVRPGLDPRP